MKALHNTKTKYKSVQQQIKNKKYRSLFNTGKRTGYEESNGNRLYKQTCEKNKKGIMRI